MGVVFRALRGLSTNLSNQPLSDGVIYFTTDDGKLYLDTDKERFLINGNSIIYVKSTDNLSFISKKDVFYVYQDLIGKKSCIKIGDGKAYLADLPFIDEFVMDHIANTDIHISAAERTSWNNKISCYLDSSNQESLVFTTN